MSEWIKGLLVGALACMLGSAIGTIYNGKHLKVEWFERDGKPCVVVKDTTSCKS